MTKQETVRGIITAVTGKNVEDRRIAALRNAGFTVVFEGVKYNWGRACSTREDGEDVLAQLHCAKGGKSRKTGYSFNRCEIYRIK
jgi:hypothetical protein